MNINETRAGSGRWCILRTSGGRTLPLAASLDEAGYDVWTPKLIVTQRRGPARLRVEIDAPILPTFVFARANRLADLAGVLALPIQPHPPFSIFRYNGRIPLIADRSIDDLRQAEIAADEHWREIKDEEHRRAEHARLKEEEAEQTRQVHVERTQQIALWKALRATAPTYARGVKVTTSRPAFAGMTGVVESQNGKVAMVDFGGRIAFAIDAWLLTPEDV